jgi:hypothetical protein
VDCEDDVRAPWEQVAAVDLNHVTRLLDIAPVAVQDVLVLETEVAREGNACCNPVGFEPYALAFTLAT